MNAKQLTRDELKLDAEHFDVVNKWLRRGDGIAVYENHDLGHPNVGHRKFLSFGSPAATLGSLDPPLRLPDTRTEINWRYQLVGVYRGEELK